MSLEMILVDGGTFTMGCTSEQSDCQSDEKPTSQVTVSSFYMGKYLVTQKLYKEVRWGNNPSNNEGDNLPVEKVTWYDAIKFCNALSEKEGLTPVYTINDDNTQADWNANGYRLPTEAEWEYAARGGKKSKGYKYSGSNDVDEVGWYTSVSRGKTQPVGLKKPNELGIYDMSGNVWEWCWDWEGRYTSESKTDPRGPAAAPCSFRVNRGGSWINSAVALRTANRNINAPTFRDNGLGFRVVRTAN